MNSIMPSNIHDFLTNADHCERMALEVRNDDLRQMYADLARQWRDLQNGQEIGGLNRRPLLFPALFISPRGMLMKEHDRGVDHLHVVAAAMCRHL